MIKKYKVVFKMEGGTIIKVKEFANSSAVIYCVSQCVPSDTARIDVEEMINGKHAGMATYEMSGANLTGSKLEGLKVFLGYGGQQ